MRRPIARVPQSDLEVIDNAMNFLSGDCRVPCITIDGFMAGWIVDWRNCGFLGAYGC